MLRRGFLGVLLAAAALSAFAAATVVLVDGRTIEGVDLTRDGDTVVIELPSGDSASIPEALVKEIRLSGSGAEDDDTVPAPTAFRTGPAETLAGQPYVPPAPSDQVAAIGRTSTFQGDVVTSSFEPSVWVPDPDGNNFAPSTWAESVVDTEWKPTSAFDARVDVMESGRSTWQKGVVDSAWAPSDGFAKSNE